MQDMKGLRLYLYPLFSQHSFDLHFLRSPAVAALFSAVRDVVEPSKIAFKKEALFAKYSIQCTEADTVH